MNRYFHKCPDCNGDGWNVEDNGGPVACGVCDGWGKVFTEEGQDISELVSLISQVERKEFNKLREEVIELKVEINSLKRANARIRGQLS